MDVLSGCEAEGPAAHIRLDALVKLADPFVRRAIAVDASCIAALLGALGYPTTEQEARERLRLATGKTHSLVLVGEWHGEVVGCLSAVLLPYFPDGSTLCRITTLVVAVSCRRRQVGTALVNAASQFAVDRGCSGVEITTAETRVGAHAFYERIGFARTSFRYFRRL